MTIGANTGTIAWTPGSSQTNFRIVVRDASSNTLRVPVSVPVFTSPISPLVLTTSTLGVTRVADYLVNTNLSAFGGQPPYTFFHDASGNPLPDTTRLATVATVTGQSNPGNGYYLSRPRVMGTSQFRLGVVDAAGNVATRNVTIQNTNLTTWFFGLPASGTGASPTPPTLGQPYTQRLYWHGGTPPYTLLSTRQFPAGLSLSNDGTISGTPGECGDAGLEYRFRDSTGEERPFGAFNFVIGCGTPVSLDITDPDLGVIAAGNSYSRTLSLSPVGGSASPPYTFSLTAGSLPPGLFLFVPSEFDTGGNSNNFARLTGVPTIPGNYSFTIRVQDGAGNIGQRVFKLTVSGLTFLTTGLARGTVGQFYSQQIRVAGGTPPYTFSVPSTALPPLVSLNAATGVLSGVPTTTFNTNFDVTVTDANGATLVRNYSLFVSQLAITDAETALPEGFYGLPYTYTFTPSPAGSYTWSATGLPSGLTLNASTGVLSGAPSGTGTFGVVLTLTSGASSVFKNFTLRVRGVFNNNLVSIPGTNQELLRVFPGQALNQAVNITGGKPPYTVTLVGGAFPTGLSLGQQSALSGSTGPGIWAIQGQVQSAPGTFNIRLRFADSSTPNQVVVDRDYVIRVLNFSLPNNDLLAVLDQPYSYQYRVGGGAGCTFAVPDTGSNFLPTGLTLSPSGLLSGTPVATGLFSFTLSVTCGGVTNLLSTSVNVYQALAPNRRVGLSINSQQFLALGRNVALDLAPAGTPPYSWVVSGALPPGLSFRTGANLPAGFGANDAIVLGVPTTAGFYPVTFRVTDANGTVGQRVVFFRVGPLRVFPTFFPIDTPALPNNTPPARVGDPFDFTIRPLNGTPPFTYSVLEQSAFPPGVTFNPATGRLTGTPTQAGTFAFSYLFTDSGGAFLVSGLTIVVFPANQPLGLNTPAGTTDARFAIRIPSGSLGNNYRYVLDGFVIPGRGTPPFTWSVAPGTSLPPGLTITGNALTGVPTVAGTYTYSIIVTDGAGTQSLVGDVRQSVVSLNVSPAPGPLPAATVGVPYSRQLTASGGTPPYTFALNYLSDLPVGMSLSPSGLISGTPTTEGPLNWLIDVTDSANQVFTQHYTMPILNARDGRFRIGTYDPASGVWRTDANGNNVFDSSPADGFVLFSLGAGETRVTGDWNGDGKTEIGVYLNGTWLLDFNGNNVYDGPIIDRLIFFGGAGFTPFTGDWSGDGRSKIAVHQNGTWLIDFNGNFQWDGAVVDRQIFFGGVGFTPYIGKWGGGPNDSIAVHQNGTWLIDFNDNFAWDGPATDRLVFFGGVGFTPVIGDWDGNGSTNLGAFQNGTWLLDVDGNFAWNPPVDQITFFGGAGYTPVAGDWNASGTTKIGAFLNGTWVLDRNGNLIWDGPATDVVTAFGAAGQSPLVGRW